MKKITYFLGEWVKTTLVVLLVIGSISAIVLACFGAVELIFIIRSRFGPVAASILAFLGFTFLLTAGNRP